MNHHSHRATIPAAIVFLTVFLVLSSLTRITLLILHFGEVTDAFWHIPFALTVGIIFDLFVGLCITAPIALLSAVLPSGWRGSILYRWPLMLLAYLSIFGLIYLSVTELFFFDEFSSRFNYVAVDYLLYPHEVFVNLWETYPILCVLIATAILAAVILWLVRKLIYDGLKYPRTGRGRLGLLLVYSAVIAVGFAALDIDSERISDNRILNEITGNGIYSVVYAGFTNELDYTQYYAQLDRPEAFRRLRQLLDDGHSTWPPGSPDTSILRRVTSDRPLHRFNVVLVLEESFGSNFIGALHPDGKNLTPCFDSLAGRNMLFTHLYATGNRTVRGLEAALCSFPPIPGRSIVKRPGSEHVFTLPALLKENDYSTVFLYGGHAYFDNFEHFASTNNFDRVIDESDFINPTFSTIWGVCDEDLFRYSLETFDSLCTLDKPFFATLITVSNHSPFTYPEGHIPFDPKQQTRENVVRYADYAIGKFIEDAKDHDFFDSTLFIFMADHGARVYGSEQIPMESYEVPILFVCPSLVDKGTRVDVLGSQLDLAPTILDLLGFDYDSEFFGRSLLSTPPELERALISHNRDVALLKDNQMAVLGIQGNRGLWSIEDSTGRFVRATGRADSTLIWDAIAYYQTAYHLFSHHELRPSIDGFSANR